MKKNILKNINAGIVVFFVALPLCLGIAIASGAPPISGIISGIIGGVVVGLLSGSNISVSGPAAGLTIILISTQTKLGSFEALLVSIFLMGIFQILFSIFRVGFISNLFPTSVIKGMLSGIGAVLVLKQLPHAVGWDHDFEGDLSFFQNDEYGNTLSTLTHIFEYVDLQATTVFLISLAVIFFWDSKWSKFGFLKKLIPSQFLAVIFGAMSVSFLFDSFLPEHLIQIPNSFEFLTLKIEHFLNPHVYFYGLVLAVIGSLETLLSVDAADKIDPLKRSSNMNRELFAQGTGNFLCGLVGGLPVTSVVVRTTTNVQAGATTRLASISHGLFLLVAVVLIPNLLNKIPLSSLAAILILVGYKLCSYKTIKSMWKLGWNQFLPYFVTLLAIVFTDLLTGVGLGLAIGSIFILYQNTKPTTILVSNGPDFLLRINRDMSFLNKSELKKNLSLIPSNSTLIIESRRPVYIDHDIQEIFRDFEILAKGKNIKIEIHGTWRINFFRRTTNGII